jgi:hypothetical protein
MLSRVHNKLGTAGLIVAVVALIAALGGAAFAASGKLTSREKKEVQKIAKKVAKAGPAGPQGPKGDVGAKGDQGAKGDTGPEGKQGPKGDTGEAGMCSDGNPDCSLAAGATLTGAWSAVADAPNGTTLATISFPVQVLPEPRTLYVTTVELFGTHTLGLELKDGSVGKFGFTTFSPEELEKAEKATKEACPGSFDSPEAAAGFLCLYSGDTDGIILGPNFGSTDTEAANEFGIHVPFRFQEEAAGTSSAMQRGSWAVTG